MDDMAWTELSALGAVILITVFLITKFLPKMLDTFAAELREERAVHDRRVSSLSDAFTETLLDQRKEFKHELREQRIEFKQELKDHREQCTACAEKGHESLDRLATAVQELSAKT
tara:strand:+ start:85 stop:429 length:345 start_codon:yes stop_codon:yes gene_type:complete